MVLLGSLLAVMVLLGSLLSVMVLLGSLLSVFMVLLRCLLFLFGLLHCLLGLLACLFGCFFGLLAALLGLVFSGLHDHGDFLGIERGKHGNNETLSLLGSTAAEAGNGKCAKIRSGTHPLSLHCPVNLRHIGVGANDEG